MRKTGTFFGFIAILLALVSGSFSTMCESGSATPIVGEGDADSDADGDADSDADADGEIIPPGNDSGLMVMPKCQANCPDFPAGALYDEGVGADAPNFFGADPNEFSPTICVMEPQLGSFEEGQLHGTLFPANWLRPRFRFETVGGENLFEIRLAAEKEANDIVIYTLKNPYILSEDIWNIIRTRVIDQPITVTVRGVNMAAPGVISGMRGDIMIAPVRAGGQMLYWATTSSEVLHDTSKLVSLIVDNPTPVDALTVDQVGDRRVIKESGYDLRSNTATTGVAAGFVECIGCHVATPDGKAVSFTDHWPWNIVLASVDTVNQEVPVGAQPSYVTPGAQVILNQPWLGMQTFSPAFWSDTDKTMVAGFTPRTTAQDTAVGWVTKAPYPSAGDTLIWIDLQTPFTFTGQGDATTTPDGAVLNAEMAQAFNSGAFGFLPITGEPLSISSPDWSNDGNTIVYTASTTTKDGRMDADNVEVDIHTVPYNNRAGGEAKVLFGANDPNYFEYYPSFSADDQLVAFNRAAASPDMVYYRPDSEVYIVPSTGADMSTGNLPTRLEANSPPTCFGGAENQPPNVFNSWPKWSPSVISTTAVVFPPVRTYYFLIFSSARAYPERFIIPPTQYSPPDTRSSQLYVTTIVRDNATGTIETYPAIYLWNQDPYTSNLTPAWDDFKISPVIK